MYGITSPQLNQVELSIHPQPLYDTELSFDYSLVRHFAYLRQTLLSYNNVSLIQSLSTVMMATLDRTHRNIEVERLHGSTSEVCSQMTVLYRKVAEDVCSVQLDVEVSNSVHNFRWYMYNKISMYYTYCALAHGCKCKEFQLILKTGHGYLFV